MKKIAFDTLIPHGKVETRINDGVLELTTLNSITSIAYNLVGNSYKRHYLELPERAHIPFTLTMRLKLVGEGLILLIGDGHILFNCPSNRSVEDPVKPSGKVFADGHLFDSRLPLNQFTTVTISFGMKEMQVSVDGREAFYTEKLPYMRAKELPEVSEGGVKIGFEIAKLSKLYVSDIELTELKADEPLARPEPYCSAEYAVDMGYDIEVSGKPAFEGFISRFRDAVKDEIIKTDAVFKSLKTLKFKRTVDPRGNKLTYTASDYGVSYIIRCANGVAWQSFSFYVVTAGPAATWHRKADYMEEVLQEIGSTNPALAERIFNALNDCVGCYGSRCIVKTPYSYGGKCKLACHGVVMLQLCHEDFEDVRDFFTHLNSMLAKKAEEGTLQTEKILLLK